MTLKYVNKFIFMLYVYIDRFCEIYPEQLQILSFGFIYEISFIHLQGLQNEVLYHEWLLIGQAQFVLTPEGDSEGLAADWLIFSGPVHTLSFSALWRSEWQATVITYGCVQKCKCVCVWDSLRSVYLAEILWSARCDPRSSSRSPVLCLAEDSG